MKGRTLDGKHVARRQRRLARPVLPIAAGLVVAAATVGGVTLSHSGNDSGNGNTQRASAATADTQPDRATIPQHASRGKSRTESSKSDSKGSSSDAGDQSNSVGESGSCKADYLSTGSTTASGEKFDSKAYTGANMFLRFGSKVRITNEATGKSVVIRINDRGGFVQGRCFDLTTTAYSEIASLSDPTVQISYVVIS